MIRKSQPTDIDDIVNIWLRASIEAHDFMEPSFWRSKAEDMRNKYIPACETYVHEEDGYINGFISIHERTIAALFVDSSFQGKGIGSELIEHAIAISSDISLCVYSSNTRSISFYKKHGFQKIYERIDEHTNFPEIMMKMNP